MPELAAIARLPADPALPGLARAVAPPPAIPVPGPHTRPLGISDAEAPRPVGLAVAGLGYRSDRAVAIALSPRLGHTTGANGFFTGLAAAARASSGQAALECWWSERRCAALWADPARPDGYGRWTDQPPAGRPSPLTSSSSTTPAARTCPG